MSLHHDRVRGYTAEAVLRRIDEQTVEQLAHYAGADAGAIRRRLDDLEREWDTDRAIELEASVMGLIGLALGVSIRSALLAIPMAVGGAVLLHALTGWYPMLPFFRRMGVRTAREIHRERYALKALRGDFAGMERTTPHGGRAVTAPPDGAHRIQ